MSDVSSQAKFSELSARVDSLVLGLKVGGMAVLSGLSLINLADSFAIGHFRIIFLDALGPDHPLPLLTHFFLNYQGFVTFLAILWLAGGLVAGYLIKDVSRVMVVLSILLVLVFVQIGLNWVALFTPMFQLN